VENNVLHCEVNINSVNSKLPVVMVKWT